MIRGNSLKLWYLATAIARSWYCALFSDESTTAVIGTSLVIYCCVFPSDASGYSLLWHVTTGQVLSKQKEDRQTLASAVAPGCETFCTTGSDGCLFIYDANTHTKLRTLEPR